MLAYQAIEYYKLLLAKLGNMNELLEPIETFSGKYHQFKKVLVEQVYAQCNVNSKNDITVAIELKLLTDYKTSFRIMFDAFDLISFVACWHNTKKEISHSMPNSDNDILLFEYIGSVDSMLFEFQHYFRDKSFSNSCELSDRIMKTSQKRYDTLSHYEEAIKMIGSETITDHKIEENSDILSIQLLEANLTLEDFAAILNGINSIYQQISRLINNDIKLEIIKIESGSLLSKVLGDKNVISAIDALLNGFVDLAFKKFTYEGQIARQIDAMKAIKECAELGNLLAPNAGSSDINESLAEATGIIAKNLLLFAKKGGHKIKINDNVHSINESLANKYLESTQIALLEEKLSEPTIRDSL